MPIVDAMALGPDTRLSGGGKTVRDLLASGERSFSFEFFPPKDEAGSVQLWRALRELEPLQPTFVSVTYGAGGSTRDRTVGITRRIARETSLTPMAHLTCVGHSRAELRSVIGSYADAGVRNVLALRGDPPGGPGTPWTPTPGGLRYASELVALVRSTVALSTTAVASAGTTGPTSGTRRVSSRPRVWAVTRVSRTRAGASGV